MKHLFLLIIPLAVSCLIAENITAQDWPMWRYDAGRTAQIEGKLPDQLHLQWVRELPPLKTAFNNKRLQFDAGYEPVAAGGVLVIGSSHNDSVTAYDLSTGKETWRFWTNGPVRFAPVIWEKHVLFGSDDGYFYCVDLLSGKLIWKKQAVPSDRKILGNERLISVWPVRGGAVVENGIVYFAAGIWPFEGIFVYALEVKTGKLVWLNDRLGTMYGDHPHNTVAVGGLAPQGYLVLSDDELIIPCSAAYPARLNKKTGELIEFSLPKKSRYPGGWFASVDPQQAKDIRRGKLKFDDVINRQQHEDKLHLGTGVTGISRKITVGGKEISFEETIKGVEEPIHSMLVADQRLVVVTQKGKIYCFAEAPHKRLPLASPDSSTHYLTSTQSEKPISSPELQKHVKQLIASSASDRGIAYVIGLKNGDVLRELIYQSNYQVFVIEKEEELVSKIRQELDRSGLYGTRCVVNLLEEGEFGLPPYSATLITTEDPLKFQSFLSQHGNEIANTVRPYGGVLALSKNSPLTEQIEEMFQGLESLSEFKKTVQPDSLVYVREGSLTGTANYRGHWETNQDELVRFPLGLLWFNDVVRNFKRAPQPQFIDGVMVSVGKDWRGDHRVNAKTGFPLVSPSFSDVYTGRLFAPNEQQSLRKEMASIDLTAKQPYQYRPPYQTELFNPPKPKQGNRINPLTGQQEKRLFPKDYGCDGGVDYGDLFTMRSGTPAFYDKTLESGTMYLSGPRSGCTNSIIPANGLLNVPYFYEGCTCSYPLPSSLALYPMPESHEQWVVWGKSEPDNIKRVGINFGAPGDRMTREGTLWLNYPDVGGPSPQLMIETTPTEIHSTYRHSVWIKNEEKWPWVYGSAVEGLREFKLSKLHPGEYTVRLYFSEEQETAPRNLSVSLQRTEILKNFDINSESKGHLKGIYKEFNHIHSDGSFEMKLSDGSRINGLELIFQKN